ncbi:MULTISPECIES: hypothetical protein [Oxalobacteraceae]|uniref:hypothetical protein n=1 Tax=Herminiimonas sp. Marseille-P9896 TaxID=2742211 RepID=UPI00158E3FD3|nr:MULTISPECIES: hypothetical protein [Oxalobacteraceae]
MLKPSFQFFTLILLILGGCHASLNSGLSLDCESSSCISNSDHSKNFESESLVKGAAICTDIGGEYTNLGEVSLWGIFESIPQKNNDIQWHREQIREIPFTWEKKEIRYRVGPQIVTDISEQKNESAFHQNSRVLIKQEGNALLVSLMGSDGLVYKTNTIVFLNSSFECKPDVLSLKFKSIFGGAEGAPGLMTSTELRLRKSNSGALELNTEKQIWTYSRIFGAVGEPKIERTSSNFSNVP